MTSGNYDQKRVEAQRFYFSLKELYCPVLNTTVVFTRVGWRHLLYKGYRNRSVPDQLRRFVLLQCVRAVIEAHDSKVAFRRQEVSGALFLSLSKRIGDKDIRVILLQKDPHRKKQFLSVMEKSTLKER